MIKHNIQQQSQSIVRTGMKRPSWICSNAKQNVVLVRDKSSSMQEDNKANAAYQASVDLVTELARPINKDGFNVAIVDFSNSSEIVHPLEKATVLSERIKPLIPSGSTNITSGLENALSIIESAEINSQQEKMTYLRPVVILFSDGCHNAGTEPYGIADRIKAKCDLVTVAFGLNADENLLIKLASTPQHFYRCANGNELRKFLAQVGATLTGTMASGINATKALREIR